MAYYALQERYSFTKQYEKATRKGFFVIIFAQNTLDDFDTDCISAFLWVRNESLFLNTFDYICNQKNIETHFWFEM